MTIRNIAGLQYLLDHNPLFHRRDIHFWPDDDRINDLFTNILTTLSGYTTPETPEEPDLALVKTLSDAGCRVIAEGRYNTPAQAADAMRHGAWAVTVGSAITRLEHICQWYNTAMKKAVL